MVAVALLVAAGGCVPGQSSSRRSLPPSPPEVRVVQSEYHFDFGHFQAGRVVVRVQNAGKLPHELVIASVPKDSPPFEQQAQGQIGFAPLFLMPKRPPGGAGMFAIDLAPGRYAMICLIQDSDGIGHHKKGMVSEFTVG